VRIGTTITPLPRRRPWKVAAEAMTLDRLSGGRLVLGVGSGDPASADNARMGGPADPRARAAILDEALEVIDALWRGEPVEHAGGSFRLHGVALRPRPVQRPRIPIWVGRAADPPRPARARAALGRRVPVPDRAARMGGRHARRGARAARGRDRPPRLGGRLRHRGRGPRPARRRGDRACVRRRPRTGRRDLVARVPRAPPRSRRRARTSPAGHCAENHRGRRIAARPVEERAVGWVVKQWRTEAARERAERDARRARRAADRATASVAAQLEALEALERLGVELRAHVGARRAAPAATDAAGARTAAAHAGPGARRHTERASLRGGALAELFRATEPRRPRSAPPAA
jgi:hypothetical protein